MKKIEAIIREEKLQDIRVALEEQGFGSMTVYDVKGRGAQGGITLQWRVGEYRIDFLPKKLIMLVVKEDQVKEVTDTICRICKTGAAGDGKIFISTIDEVIRIRTEESGEPAL
ncbi:MAG TPA: P-II family nitrogen regulator [Firmicutes bacterium]|jgi:nitrogen regulatory protein P-II 1|nr:P-II family nitrogen regulator [Bacillota bacterium]